MYIHTHTHIWNFIHISTLMRVFIHNRCQIISKLVLKHMARLIRIFGHFKYFQIWLSVPYN